MWSRSTTDGEIIGVLCESGLQHSKKTILGLSGLRLRPRRFTINSDVVDNNMYLST